MTKPQMERRKPKKGEGVPRETRERNNLAALQAALQSHFPDMSWDELPARLEDAGFFEAGMSAQVRMMAEVALDMLPPGSEPAGVIAALAASPVQKIRGVAAVAVPLVHPDDLERQLRSLWFTSAIEGIWPRELSNSVLHDLVIAHGFDAVFSRVALWLEDPEPALRRVVAEAFRPRGVMMPHIGELKDDPAPLQPLLEALLDDPSDYVRKAVANNINDVSKDNPDVALAWCREWSTPDATEERRWIITRGLRTLVDSGYPEALRLLGYAQAGALALEWITGPPPAVEINQLLPFEFDVHNPTDADAQIILRLLLDEPGKGSNRRKSTYQLWKGVVSAGATKRIGKRIHFVDKNRQPKESGEYRLVVTLNGEVVAERTMIFER